MGKDINSLNAELNPTCHLLALLGARHIFHVSGLRVKSGDQSGHRTLILRNIHDTIYDMIYLLTEIGLTPGGSSRIRIYTQTVHRTTQLTTLVGKAFWDSNPDWSKLRLTMN